MKKIFLFVLLLSVMSVVLIACQSNDNKEDTDVNKPRASVSNEDTDVNKSSVSISMSSGFGKINSNFFAVYEDKETLDIFNNAISNAIKVDGIVDMSEPLYDLEVISADGEKQTYHLWLGGDGEKSSLMHVDDTHTVYSISEELTNQLGDVVR